MVIMMSVVLRCFFAVVACVFSFVAVVVAWSVLCLTVSYTLVVCKCVIVSLTMVNLPIVS